MKLIEAMKRLQRVSFLASDLSMRTTSVDINLVHFLPPAIPFYITVNLQCIART